MQSLRASSLFNVLLAGTLILVYKILDRVFTKPVGEGHELLPQLADGLLIHVGLSDELGEGNYANQ